MYVRNTHEKQLMSTQNTFTVFSRRPDIILINKFVPKLKKKPYICFVLFDIRFDC